MDTRTIDLLIVLLVHQQRHMTQDSDPKDTTLAFYEANAKKFFDDICHGDWTSKAYREEMQILNSKIGSRYNENYNK
jgi:hypothetical protein